MRAAAIMGFTLSLNSFALAQAPHTFMPTLQALEGTISVSYLPQFSEGKLNACLLEFNALVRDHASRAGQYSKVGGSFGFFSINGQIAPVLKLIIHEIDDNFSLNPTAPQRAYIANGNFTNKNEIVAATQSDTPGSLFVIFKPENSDIFIKSISDRNIKILYGRSQGGMDVPINLDLSVENTDKTGRRRRSSKSTDEMFVCIKDLIGLISPQ